MRHPENYPNFEVIEEHVRRARIERSLVISQMIVAAIQAIVAGVRKAKAAMDVRMDAELERRHLEADPFLKRSVRY